MSDPCVAFFEGHAYAVLFGVSFASDAGVPIPSEVAIVAAGALAARGELNAPLGLALVLLAATLGNGAWFEIGRRRGRAVLGLLCRISLEPDSCVRRTEDMFARHGARSIVLSKFVPGLGTAAPALAGIFRMPPARFFALNLASTVVWAGAFGAIGWQVSGAIAELVERVRAVGASVGVLIAAALALYVAWKYGERWRFLRSLRIARITPHELKRILDERAPTAIFDLRRSVDFRDEPETIPGAVRIDAEDLERRHAEIPRDREVIVYCT